jgi:uncharacterized membrane protein YkvA (DUF1232 family)
MVGDALSGRYAALGRSRLAMLGLALAYIVSPVDFVPEALVPLLGLADDGVVALWLAGAFLAETDRYLAWDATGPPSTRTGADLRSGGRRGARPW